MKNLIRKSTLIALLAVGASSANLALADSYQASFEANNAGLYTYSSASGPASLSLGMLSGTNPSVAAVPGGYQTAFQANTGALWVTGAAGTVNTNQGMMPGTSPSIAVSPKGG